jgi:FAD:protein FMN transferase
MKPYSKHRPIKFAIERAQPLLGTVVSMRVGGLRVKQAHRAIDAAFAEVAAVHRLMSVHDRDSDVGRLNRCAAEAPVSVDKRTAEVLRTALVVSAASNGCFDVAVGADLVDCGLLPQHRWNFRQPCGSWRDIEIGMEGRVLFHRPLWIDLGGIAKGYAVDRAIEVLRLHGAACCVVNAGGDIRVAGDEPERITLGAPSTEGCAALELSNGSVASSSSERPRGPADGQQRCGSHVHGARRSPVAASRFACVLAECCTVADALTKIVLAEGPDSDEILKSFGAAAHFHEASSGWLHLGAEMEAA